MASSHKWLENGSSHYQLWCHWNTIYLDRPILPHQDYKTKTGKHMYYRRYWVWMGKDRNNKHMPYLLMIYIGDKKPPEPFTIIKNVKGYIRTYKCFSKNKKDFVKGTNFFIYSFVQQEKLKTPTNTYDMAKDWKEDYEEVVDPSELQKIEEISNEK